MREVVSIAVTILILNLAVFANPLRELRGSNLSCFFKNKRLQLQEFDKMIEIGVHHFLHFVSSLWKGDPAAVVPWADNVVMKFNQSSSSAE